MWRRNRAYIIILVCCLAARFGPVLTNRWRAQEENTVKDGRGASLIIGFGFLIIMFSASGAAQTISTSTPADHQQLSLTVYNSGAALVRDTRLLKIPSGRVLLRFHGVAAKLDPTSIHLSFHTSEGAPEVLEESYQQHLLTPGNLLAAYVGKTLTLFPARRRNSSPAGTGMQAKLLADNPGGPVWEVNGQVLTGLRVDHYVFPAVPRNLYSQPTLVWLLENRDGAARDVTVSYLTDGITWSADYALTIARDGKTASLEGRAALANDSGLTYPNAELQLMAGQVARMEQPLRPINGRVMTMAAAPSQFAQQRLSAYHLYTLGCRTTLFDGEAKMASLFRAAGIPSTLLYTVQGQPSYYRFPFASAGPAEDPVDVHIQFTNSHADKLGLPLPAGTVRAYQPDSAGRLQLIGEASLSGTPSGEMVDLNLGSAFDIVEERRQTEYRVLDPNFSESAFEITLHNRQAHAVRVQVNEPFDGDWQITHANLTYRKVSAFAARFMASVPAYGEVVLKYTVQVRSGTTP